MTLTAAQREAIGRDQAKANSRGIKLAAAEMAARPAPPNVPVKAASVSAPHWELPPIEVYVEDERRAKANGAAPTSNVPAPVSDSAAAPESYRAVRLDELASAPRAGVVQGLGFDEGTVTAIVGTPNAGKTALAVSLALAVAARSARWLGLKVAGGPVVYFAAEAPGSVIMRARAAVVRQSFDHRPALYIASAAPSMGGEYTSGADGDRIVATVLGVGAAEGEAVKLVFVDTLASCLGDGDENGDGMLRLVNAAKLVAATTRVCVSLIHHPSKGDAASLRGHGSLAAACDAIVRIDVEALTGARVATLVKSRDTATGLQLRFELEQVVLDQRDSFGDAATTVVVKAAIGAAPRPRPQPNAKAQELLLGELERRHRTGETAWDRATVCKAGRDLGMHRNSPKAALDGLLRGGFVSGNDARLILTYPPECT